VVEAANWTRLKGAKGRRCHPKGRIVFLNFDSTEAENRAEIQSRTADRKNRAEERPGRTERKTKNGRAEKEEQKNGGGGLVGGGGVVVVVGIIAILIT